MPEARGSLPAPIGAIWRWVDRNILDLGRQMRLSYLPPLMVYMAAGISGLTAIVGTFFVKEYLGLSAHFLAALGFWATLPWALKMPLGHIVDLIWRHKAGLVYLGAGLIAVSVLIMIGLLGYPAALRAVMPAGAWFVLSTLLAPIGYVLQDTVADAMTVEAVPRVDADGRRLTDEERRLGQITMQTLGRVAIIGGGVLVSVANVILFRGVGSMTTVQKAAAYLQVYEWALIIPAISVLGVVLASVLRRRAARRLAATLALRVRATSRKNFRSSQFREPRDVMFFCILVRLLCAFLLEICTSILQKQSERLILQGDSTPWFSA